MMVVVMRVLWWLMMMQSWGRCRRQRLQRQRDRLHHTQVTAAVEVAEVKVFSTVLLSAMAASVAAGS